MKYKLVKSKANIKDAKDAFAFMDGIIEESGKIVHDKVDDSFSVQLAHDEFNGALATILIYVALADGRATKKEFDTIQDITKIKEPMDTLCHADGSKVSWEELEKLSPTDLTELAYRNENNLHDHVLDFMAFLYLIEKATDETLIDSFVNATINVCYGVAATNGVVEDKEMEKSLEKIKSILIDAYQEIKARDDSGNDGTHGEA